MSGGGGSAATLSVWFARSPQAGFRSGPWGIRHLMVRRRSARKMVLMDAGEDLAVVSTRSSDVLERLEVDGTLALLTSLYHQIPNLRISRKRLSVRIVQSAPLARWIEGDTDAFGRVEPLMRILAKAAHELG